MIKVLVALQVPGIDVHGILQVHRRHVVELMQRYTRLKADGRRGRPTAVPVVDAELFRLEAIVRWLDAAEVRLRRLPSAPPAAVTDSRSHRRTDGGLNDERTRTASGIEGLRLTARPRCTRCATSISRSTPASSWRSWARAAPARARSDDRRQPRRATTGEVLVDGIDVRELSRNGSGRMRRRSIGYVFQDFNLLAGLTALENVTLPLELDGVRSKAARDRRSRRWRSSVSPTTPTATRTSCRVASGSGSRSPGPIVGERRLLLADEPTGASTPSTARR